MKTIKKIGLGVVGLLGLLSIESQGQDFFNGMPGPKLTQSDHYITLDTKAKELSGTYIQKVFPSIGENQKLLMAMPIGISKDGVDIKGINLGYMKQKIGGKEIYGIVALGGFEGPSGKLTQITPQAYATLLQGGLSVDLEGAINFDTENGDVNKRGAITLGYGNSRVRGGASITFQDGQKPAYQLLGRVDLTADHKYWAEIIAPIVSNDKLDCKTVTIRFAANF